MTAPGGFTCPRCGRTSYHPDDLLSGYCGACHDWTAEADRLRVRFRLFIEQQLADERWVSLQGDDFERLARAVGDHQNALAAAADGAGRRWHVEVYDPGRHPDFAYARFGTDPDAMQCPIQIDTREEQP